MFVIKDEINLEKHNVPNTKNRFFMWLLISSYYSYSLEFLIVQSRI